MTENTALQVPRMATINEASTLTGLAKYYIRQLALQSKIKHVRAGKKILINIDRLIEFLNESNGEQEIEQEPTNRFGITRINL